MARKERQAELAAWLAAPKPKTDQAFFALPASPKTDQAFFALPASPNLRERTAVARHWLHADRTTAWLALRQAHSEQARDLNLLCLAGFAPVPKAVGRYLGAGVGQP